MGRTLTDVTGEAACESIKPSVACVTAGQTVTGEAMLDYRTAGPRFLRVSFVPSATPPAQ